MFKKTGASLTFLTCFLFMIICNAQGTTTNSEATLDTELDRLVHSNQKLRELDARMTRIYLQQKETFDANASFELFNEQKAWTMNRSKECAPVDVACLKSLYEKRIQKLQNNLPNIVPYTRKKAEDLLGVRGVCGFNEGELPEEFVVYAGGAYKGKNITYQIDDSGHQATQFEVIVNAPDTPVALLLGAYEPSIWNIAWTQGTNIAAVIATGYHRQAVSGLPTSTPVLISTYDNRGPCGSTYVDKKSLRKISALSQKVFKKNVNMVHYASNGDLLFGAPISKSDMLVTSNDTPPETYFDKSAPRTGKAGLEDYIKQGSLRRATNKDLVRWAKKKAEIHKDELPDGTTGDSYAEFKPKMYHDGYVILKEITLPSNMTGRNSAILFLNEGVPFPKGKAMHTALYDFNTMTCNGLMCR